MVAVIEKHWLSAVGARANMASSSISTTIRVNMSRLSGNRIAKLSEALERHNLGGTNTDDQEYELTIAALRIDLTWSQLAAFAEKKGTTLHA